MTVNDANRSLWRSSGWAIALSCAALIASYGIADLRPDGGEATKAQSPGHARMLELLEQICIDSARNSAYLGTAVIDEVQKELALLPDDMRDPRRWQTNLKLGNELLRVGRTEQAISAYEAAANQVPYIRDRIQRTAEATTYFLLGTAYMRLGENQNCCLRNNQDSCILPIRDGGLHDNKIGSQTAINWFERSLELAEPDSPDYTKARWLLNVGHMTLSTYPDGVPQKYRIDPKVFESDEPFPRFIDVAPQVGLREMSLAGGAAVEDFNGDGRLDIVISDSDTSGQLRLYLNDGSGRFVDRSEAANLTGLFGGLNVIHADYDNDGDVDLLVLRGGWFRGDGRHPKSLLQNNGHGVFTDVTFDAGLGASMFPTQTAGFADYDNDGDLDLYIGNESEPNFVAPCELYRNNGDGTFTDVAAATGVTNDRYTKGVAWGDYDLDRHPDLYVSNIGANRLYHNNGDGTFTDVARDAGVALPLASFSCWFFDFDNDGSLDVWVAGWIRGTPSVADVAASYLGLPHEGEVMRLYKGDGRGGFTETAAEHGLTLYTLAMGSNFGDLDNDGYLDFYLGTGFPLYEGLIPNVMYRNKSGERFADVTTAGGFGHLQKGHGVVFADLDEDGDQDVLEKIGGAYPGDAYRCVLFENPGFDAHWVKLRLVGAKSNRSGIGARIRLDIDENGAPRTIYKTVNTGSSFGCNPLRQELGVGSATKIRRLEVWWPASDTHQIFTDIAVDRAFELREGVDHLTEIQLHPVRLGG
jgi:tetratricopeptide (TPR) repeat protein